LPVCLKPGAGKLSLMRLDSVREALERNQIAIYFIAVVAGAVVALAWPTSTALEPFINPALGVMLFVTFLQVPLSHLGRAFTDIRFLWALMVGNFVVIPLVVAALLQFLPPEPLLVIGVLFVLLTPCVDYVVTFSHLGRADAKSLLAATPLLLLAQMALLPLYLKLLIGDDAAALVKAEPFLHSFVVLIAGPLLLAAILQFLAPRAKAAEAAVRILGFAPVPATAVVLFVVICAVVPQLGPAIGSVVRVAPIYVAFAIIAPFAGWLVARAFSLRADQVRAVAFSTATRNSLVILPLALAVPGAIPIVPAVIVTQTLVELLSELIYVRMASHSTS
jgi:ACR3 family arsenite transporter